MPVTTGEVQKAKISPLAASLIKQPDPEEMKGLSVREQRDFVAKWAEEQLSSANRSKSLTPQTSVDGSVVSGGGFEQETDVTSPEGEDNNNGEVTSVDNDKMITSQEEKTNPFKNELEEKLKRTSLKKQSSLDVQISTDLSSAENKQADESTNVPQKVVMKTSEPDDSGSASGKRVIPKQSSVERVKLRSIKREQSFETNSSDGDYFSAENSPEKEILTQTITEESESAPSIPKQNGAKTVSNEENVSKQNEKTPPSPAETKETPRRVIRRFPSRQESRESTGDDSETPKIRNEAVLRRKNLRERKHAESFRYHTQPVEGEDSPSSEVTVRRAKSFGGHGRHNTAPVTPQEMSDTMDGPVGSSIKDRLKALNKSGSEDWMKRIGKSKESSPVLDQDIVTLREKKEGRPLSIADRMSWLEGSQDSWKDRIEEKDAKQFTVEGMLGKKAGTPARTTTESPLANRVRKTPRVPLNRAVSSPVIPLDHRPSPEPESPTSEDPDAPTRVEVPRVDDETFSLFYEETAERKSQKIDVSVDDFDHIFMESTDILSSSKRVKAPRSNRGSRNPLKALAARDDLQTEYTEVQTGVAERELKRIKREQVVGQANFATEALAGLASKENFDKVKLRKADSFSGGTPGGEQYRPYKELMLIQVKGRRHCQLRVVNPKPISINSGDSYIMVTRDRVTVWVGQYANVIERNKSIELATLIQQKKDLGCCSVQDAQVVHSNKPGGLPGKRFWDKLGGEETPAEPGPSDEDEHYEVYINETNMIYKLEGDKLCPYEEYWGQLPKYEMLRANEVYVFDFGTEMYVWTGKNVAFAEKKLGLRLAQELWNKGYDYTECDINPFSPFIEESDGGAPKASGSRPEWAVFGKVSQNMETILFKQKFIDWPDKSGLIKVKGKKEGAKNETSPDLVPYDVERMVDVDTAPVSLVLEGANVGRGDRWVEHHDGLKREYEILTQGLDVWHCMEGGRNKIDRDSHGQFHDGDTYVIRWHYMVSLTGVKTLKGKAARNSLTGREKHAYFFWQGRNSSVTEKGASALMTVELDEERGPQIQVDQDKEPAAFMSLFKGRMMVHIGKREEEESNTQGAWRLFILLNEVPGEMYLTEIPCRTANLRSQTSFFMLNVKTGALFLWHGAASSSHRRKAAKDIAHNFEQQCPKEVGLHSKATLTITEMAEGSEKREFWSALDTKDRSVYYSMLKDAPPLDTSPRLFYYSSVKGTFEATEILNPRRDHQVYTPFPFLQSDLYEQSQPALLMLDLGYEVYLWQGWWGQDGEGEESSKAGSAVARFNVNRCCALKTTLDYCKAKYPGKNLKSYLIYGGLEPLFFTNLFPFWEVMEDVKEAQIKEGKTDGEKVKTEALLDKLTKTKYTFSELQERPLPEGVDPLRLEFYLHDKEFESILGMTRDEFNSMPVWKQRDLKKEKELF